jgi:hypothetical protein
MLEFCKQEVAGAIPAGSMGANDSAGQPVPCRGVRLDRVPGLTARPEAL